MRDVIRGAVTGAEPVSLTEAKLQCRQDASIDDAHITALVGAVRDAAEQHTRRSLVRRSCTFSVRGSDLPGISACIPLPFPPAVSLTGLEYLLSSTGATQASTLTDFALHAYDDYAYVAPRPGYYWPSDAQEVRIAYTCGYLPADIPAAIKQAVLVEVAKQYRDREGPEDRKLDYSPAFYALLAPWRVGWFQ